MWTIARLLPDISSMAMFFQRVVESLSPSQVVWHVAPALKLSPGPGSLGVTSASAKKGVERVKNATKACAANIFPDYCKEFDEVAVGID